jgi:uncharacterized protein (DUF362 family)
MRKVLFCAVMIALLLALGAGFLTAQAVEKPTVAVVKAAKHELVAESWKMNWERTISQGVNKTRKVEYLRAEWSKESEKAIEAMVRDAVELAGGWPVKPGDVVLIKPNLVTSMFFLWYSGKLTEEDFQGCFTDARIVRALAVMAKESGAKRIIVGEGPASGDGWAAFMQSGYVAMVEDLEKEGIKVELLDFTDEPYTWVKSKGLANPEYAVPKVATEATCVISVPALKTHSMTGVTLGLKNVAVGLLAGRVYGFFKYGAPHQKIPEWITDMCSIFKIHYTVVDGIWGMEGNGPLNGTPINMDLIVAGADPVAVDSVCTAIMGFDPKNIVHIMMAAQNGLGVADLSQIAIEGEKIASVAKPFKVVPEENRWPSEYGGVKNWDERYVAGK